MASRAIVKSRIRTESSEHVFRSTSSMEILQRIWIIMCIRILVVTFEISTATTSNDMTIASLSLKPAQLVMKRTTVTMHCTVARMDYSRFVQFGKIVPADGASAPDMSEAVRGVRRVRSTSSRVVFTTNVNVERTVRDVGRYSVKAMEITSAPGPGHDGLDQTGGGAGVGEGGEEVGERRRMNADAGKKGYEFILQMDDVRLEDAGEYFCSIPSLNITKYISLDVFAAPSSLQFFVDDVEISDGDHITFEAVTTHALRCVARGSNPPADVSFTLGDKYVTPDVTKRHAVTEHVTTAPRFLTRTTHTTTASVTEAMLDFLLVGRHVSCSAHVAGLSSSNDVTIGFVVSFLGHAPEFACTRHVISSPRDDDVSVTCLVHANPVIENLYAFYYETVTRRQISTLSPALVSYDDVFEEIGDISDDQDAAVENGDVKDTDVVQRLTMIYPKHSIMSNNPEMGDSKYDHGSEQFRNVYRGPSDTISEHLTDGEHFGAGSESDMKGRDELHSPVVNEENKEKLEEQIESNGDNIGPEGGNADEDDLLVLTKLAANDTTSVVKLKWRTSRSDAFRDYYIVASNRYGTTTHVVTVTQEASYDAVQSDEFSASTSSASTFNTRRLSDPGVLILRLLCSGLLLASTQIVLQTLRRTT